MLGQRDRKSGIPCRARTKWGCNGDRIKAVIGEQCDESHPHQQAMGSNKFGHRSQQKAEWPKEMCSKILHKGIVKELDERTCAHAFPAEVAA